jgi:Kef-type K+ transport system membrane component KefB
VIFTLVRAVAEAFVEPGGVISIAALRELGTGMLGSLACGTTLGLLLAAYLRLVGKQLLLVLTVMAYGVTAFTSYFHFESLLLFLFAGFVVANVTDQGERLLEAVAEGGRVVYVLFFALAGAHLNLPLVAKLWPVALALVVARVLFTFIASRLGSRVAKDVPPVSNMGWMPLVSQAGITIGMAVAVSEQFPTFGPGLGALAIVAVGINEAVGPILFKWALDRAGESAAQ